MKTSGTSLKASWAEEGVVGTAASEALVSERESESRPVMSDTALEMAFSATKEEVETVGVSVSSVGRVMMSG